ncbi:hypothetical protein ACET3Z_023988 [Daucus carota]
MAGNPNSPSSRAIGADSDHGIVLLPGCNCVDCCRMDLLSSHLPVNNSQSRGCRLNKENQTPGILFGVTGKREYVPGTALDAFLLRRAENIKKSRTNPTPPAIVGSSFFGIPWKLASCSQNFGVQSFSLQIIQDQSLLCVARHAALDWLWLCSFLRSHQWTSDLLHYVFLPHREGRSNVGGNSESGMTVDRKVIDTTEDTEPSLSHRHVEIYNKLRAVNIEIDAASQGAAIPIVLSHLAKKREKSCTDIKCECNSAFFYLQHVRGNSEYSNSMILKHSDPREQ